MFSLTIIRLKNNKSYNDAFIFENTEFNNICLLGDVLNEFKRIGLQNLEELEVLKVGQSKTIQHTNNSNKFWFIYISKLS